MEILDDFVDIEDLPETEKEVIEIESIFFFESASIFPVDFEDD